MAARILGIQLSPSLPTQKCALPFRPPTLRRLARASINRNFSRKLPPAAPSCLHMKSRSYVVARVSGASRIDPIVSTDWLSRRLRDVCILDVRGMVLTRVVEHGVEKSDYVASYDDYLEGHIPGSVFYNWVKDGVAEDSDIPVQMTADGEKFIMLLLLQPSGLHKSIEEQREVFRNAGLNLEKETRLIAYCNGGVASCTILIAWFRVGGLGTWANYDGSWNEWGNSDDLPKQY